uniref:sphinganine-1-phosphate aldolase n=1 Tax=Paramoeba aestuarina TaxID=180227 RepID=A0A7S4PDF5_9EUKA|eukprot:CAMPEP_0201515210 /NCGR_PEP_ID=MMETSP0161_2-20130828/6842_1 /ASSEMBLY_ACC=CAM_ASM_000251 /TAXON_ID=180227 /ORGANISM="Neoparamoeba aestuarina, Strain SoJaBio B1-5/56/2" /LENGTH=546 /DNA_ID=CAMNT_0047911983 /DNA_START=45 /DNA_END=1685 /DNA_ORIENTATION=+
MDQIINFLKAILTPPTGGWGRKAEHALVLLLLFKVLKFVRARGITACFKMVLSYVIGGARQLPGVGGLVNEEIEKEVRTIEKKMLGSGDPNANFFLPQKGWTEEQILTLADDMKKNDFFEEGKKWAGIYHEVNGECPLDKIQQNMWCKFVNTNGLYPGVFKSCRKFESEIVAMIIAMLNGGPAAKEGAWGREATGLLTSGGTESILISILSYREEGRKKGIFEPEIICSRAAHGALDKACFYFGIKLVKLEANKNFQLDVNEVRNAITPNTVCVYASAPSFPHGIVDPIEELAKVTKAKGVGLHVDNCLGGFYLSSLSRLGIFKKKFDFRVPGVTTISIDVHKYGFAPKGCSVVCFANNELRSLSLHPVTTGLTLYVTPTLQGSRGQGVTAAAWATMMNTGIEGYNNIANQLHGLIDRVIEAVNNIDGIKIAVRPDLAIVPIAGEKGVNIFAVSGLMEERGWSVFTSRDPALMGWCVGQQYERVLDDWIKDLTEVVKFVKANPNTPITGSGAVYGAATVLPDDVLDEVMRNYVGVTMKVKQQVKEE